MYRCSLLWFYTIFFGGTFCEAWKCKLLEFHIRCRSAATVLWCDGPLLWRRMPQCSVVWCLTAKLCCLDDKLPMWMLPNFVLFCFCTKRKKKTMFLYPNFKLWNCSNYKTEHFWLARNPSDCPKATPPIIQAADDALCLPSESSWNRNPSDWNCAWRPIRC